jgi:hypothetical protein
MRRAGLWDSWPLNPRDLDAVRTGGNDATAALVEHLTAVASASDYVIDIDGLRLVFMSTGRDVLPRWRTVESGRLGMLMRSIPVSYEHPDSEGFTDRQITDLRSALAGCSSAALFFHAPLLHPRPGSNVDPRLDAIDPGDDDSAAARLRYERRLFSSGHRHGVFFRNVAPFVRAIADFQGALASFSGHVHGTHVMELQPAQRRIRSVSIDRAGGSGAHVLLNAPALGQTATRGGEPPGYLLARFEAGRLTGVECRRLGLDL